MVGVVSWFVQSNSHLWGDQRVVWPVVVVVVLQWSPFVPVGSGMQGGGAAVVSVQWPPE